MTEQQAHVIPEEKIQELYPQVHQLLTNLQTPTGKKKNLFEIVKQIDKSSPKLMEACCTGEHLPAVQLSLVNKESQLEYMKIKLTDVLISSYQTGGAGAGGAVPVDQVSFNFNSVDIQAADKQGRFVSQVSCNFVKGGDGQIGHDHD